MKFFRIYLIIQSVILTLLAARWAKKKIETRYHDLYDAGMGQRVLILRKDTWTGKTVYSHPSLSQVRA